MSKRKDTSTEDEVNIDLEDVALMRKHRKRKHKKHRRRKTAEEGEGVEDVESSKHRLKLKIKWAKVGPGTSAAAPTTAAAATEKMGCPAKLSPPKLTERSGTSSKRRKGKGKDSGTSSEEERWLDAIESGKLEEVDDELKKIKLKDPKLMTARQRAILERKSDKEPGSSGEQLVALPTGFKQKVMTAEAIQKALLKSQRRKQLAEEKREKDKKKTMERLLKKQECKGGKSGQKVRVASRQGPHMLYRSCYSGISMSLPSGMDFPLQPQLPRTPPQVTLCAVEGCRNVKKYSCSKTGVPLCSFECYRKNLMSRGS